MYWPIGTIEATQWNNKLRHGRDCPDHPEVRGTSYEEVHSLLKTNGCSNDSPYYNWVVMGVITTIYGNDVIVAPTDWIIENEHGILFVMKDKHYSVEKTDMFDESPINK